MMTLEEAAQLAEAAQHDALQARAQFDEQKALHKEVTEWRQAWEKDVIDRREAEGKAPYPDKTLSMLSEMAYKDHDPDAWRRYIDSAWNLERATQAAHLTAAASQVTALHMNMQSQERLRSLEEGWQRRQLDEGGDAEE